MDNKKYYYSYVMVKPGFANNRRIIKYVIDNILDLRDYGGLPDLILVDQKYVQYDQNAVNIHYKEHIGKDFFKSLSEYLQSDKAYGMVFMSSNPNMKAIIRNAVKELRQTVPEKFRVHTDKQKNVLHASDEKARSEVSEIHAFQTLPAIIKTGQEKEFNKNF